MSTTERLIYLPLGGAGEIGMNAYVYGYGEAGREKLIVVDLGVTFPDMGSTPGVDLIFPEHFLLEARRHDIEGIFITHAHEDRVGAIGHLWDKLGAPIYARSFTSHIARRKMADQGHPEVLKKTAEAWPSQIEVGVFQWLYSYFLTRSQKAVAYSFQRQRAELFTLAISKWMKRLWWVKPLSLRYGKRFQKTGSP